MKKGFLILAGAGLLSLYALISIDTLRAETFYYAPVANSTGEKAAYVKRLLKYSAWGGQHHALSRGEPDESTHSQRPDPGV